MLRHGDLSTYIPDDKNTHSSTGYSIGARSLPPPLSQNSSFIRHSASRRVSTKVGDRGDEDSRNVGHLSSNFDHLRDINYASVKESLEVKISMSYFLTC